MKKRILSLALCIIMLVSSVPFAPIGTPVGGLAVTAGAISTVELKEVFDSIPEKSRWEELFVDSTDLAALYDEAEDMINNPGRYTQTQIDSAARILQRTMDSMEYHTTGLSLSKTKLSIKIGQKATITAVTEPKNAADKIKWTSSDTSVITVNDGEIYAKAFSKNPVTVTATSNGHSAKCSVTTVNQLTGVKLSASSKTIYDNQTFTLKATPIGEDSSAAVTDEVVYTWDSSDERVVSVDDNGKVSGVSKGTAEISVIASSGGVKYTATCKVTVKEIVLITSLKALTLTNSGVLTMVIGETETFRVQVTPKTADIKNLSWTSSNKKVATVSAGSVSDAQVSVKIKAVGSGTSKITYKATDGSGKKGSFTVKVLPLVSALSISETVKVIAPDSTGVKLKVTVSPSNAGNQVINWSSSNKNVCTVDRLGRLTPKAKGTCTITAKTTDGSNISVSCRLRVGPKASAISLSKSSLKIVGEKSVTLTAKVRTVENTTYTGFVEWMSDNPKVASVDKNGKITAKYPGTAKIKAITTDGTNKSAACVVEVSQPVKGVSLPSKETVSIGKKVTLKATFKPTYAENKKVKWSSDKTSIATVSSSGVVTAKKAGSCYITVKTVDGGYKAKCKITVVVPTKSVKLNKTSVSLKVGGSAALTASISPSNATNKAVTWTSSNKKIATVSSKGVVKAISGGKCVITAKNSGGQTASCTIRVSEGLDSIKLNKSSLTLYKTQVYALKMTLEPKSTTVTSFSWSSSNKNVAKVSSSGVITAVGTGSAVITVKSGSVSAKCNVKVVKKVSVTSIRITSKLELNKGQTYPISTEISPSNASDKGITWTSSNKKVATVSSSGIVKGLKPGTAVITARTDDGGYTDKCSVSVSQSVTGIRINHDSIKLSKGKTKTITATVFPVDANNRKVKWTSSNTAVAKVNQNGVVTAVKNGTAIITATTVDGGYSASCTVKVYNTTTGIKLSRSSLKISKGDSKALYASVSPSNATNKDVKWSSSDRTIVTVSSSGQITGIRKGVATITAKTVDGGHKATCVVTVVQYATSVSLDSSSITIKAGKTKMLYARVKPSTASNKKIKWSSSNTKVAKVNSEGKLTAVAGGNAVIRATSGDGKVYASCKVTVIQSVSKIKLSPSSMNIGIGERKIIKATVSPATATDQSLKWTSSNTKVATVDSDGVVKGIKKGKANITAESSDGGAKAICKVNVTKAVTGVKLDKAVISMKVGQKTAVKASVVPSSANNKSVSWSTNNYDVATVSSDGVIIAKGPGYAEITAKTKDGGYKAVSKVTVIQPAKGISLNVKSKTLDVNQKYTLKVKFTPKNTSNDTVKWSSSDSKVVKVTSSGVIKALKKGKAVITAKSVDGGFKAKCTVTVIQKVKSVSLNKTALTLYLGKTETLKAAVSPSSSSNKAVKWSSSNTAVVKVSSSGKLTPVKVGKATVSVKTNDGGRTAKCVVTVEKAIESFSLSKSSISLTAGKSYTLKGIFKPTNATNKTLTWSTSNKNVASVSGGIIKAVSGGSAKITAKTSNGLKAYCTVNVIEPVSSVKLSQSEETLYVGDSFTLKATVSPSNATDKGVKWASSNSNIASVSSSGKVTAVAPGEAVITVTTADGAKTANCVVTVKRHVEGIGFEKDVIELANGQSMQLEPIFEPADASDKSVLWYSSDSSIVSVSSLGKITALSVGEAEITVTALDGGYEASCTVIVNEPVTGFDIFSDKSSLYVGESLAIYSVITPSDATNKAIRWSSSEPIVAAVSSKGVVSANKAGKAVITATTVDGGYSAQLEITVLQKSENLLFEKSELVVAAGESTVINATVLPEDCTDKTLKWSSSNNSVASVDSSGTVTGLNPGKAVITAETVDGITAGCAVTVTRSAQEIKLSETSKTIYKGNRFTLTATVLPQDTTDKTVEWTSSDPTVASVKDGVVTARAGGSAVITASTCGGKIFAVCMVEVLVMCESIELSTNSLALREGEKLRISAVVLPAETNNKTVVWKSSDENVATVENGIIAAKSKGTAVITAQSEENSAAFALCEVTVLRPVTGITITNSESTVYCGESFSAEASVLPIDASDTEISWSSSDEGVAAVSNGTVTGISIGNAVITAQSRDGGFKAQFSVEVKQKAQSIEFEKSIYEVSQGDLFAINVRVLPENTSDKTLIWSSSDERFATVDSAGNVTAIAAGEVWITAKATVGGAENSALVKIIIPAQSVEISGSDTAFVGDEFDLSAKVLPENATYKDVTWTSDNAEVVRIDSSTGKAVAVGAGQAKITAQSHCKKASSEFTVTVKQPVTQIRLEKTSIILGENTSTNLDYTVLPENAFDKTVTWKSADENVATVSDGIITGVAKGETVITVTSADGRVSAVCNVKVQKLVSSVSISQSSAIIEKGKTFTLKAEVFPADADDKTIRWISENESVAIVSSNGVVTAVSPGKAVITALTSNESVKASCEVTVKVYSSAIEILDSRDEIWLDETLSLSAKVIPDDVTENAVIWSCSNNDIAQISSSGVLVPKSSGTVTVTAKAADTGVTAQKEIKISIREATVSITDEELTVQKGQKHTLKAAVLPETATYKDIIWSSSNSDIVSVGENGEITANAVGSAVITAKTAKNGLTATCTVTVVQNPSEIILSLQQAEMFENEEVTVTASFLPADATETQLIWESADENIAVVENGVIKGVSKGTTEIFAISKADGSISAKCSVEVKRKAAGISLSKTEAEISVGEQFKCEAVITPEGANEQGIIWSSSDETVAVVDENGIVTAKTKGTAIIYAETVDGGYLAFCLVSVK